MTEIPIFESPFFTETVTLTGKDYVLDFAYNQRENRWYLSILDVNKDPISMGRKIVPNIDLFRQCADPRKPAGKIVALSLGASDEAPTLEELGVRVKLFYYEPGESIVT